MGGWMYGWGDGGVGGGVGGWADGGMGGWRGGWMGGNSTDSPPNMLTAMVASTGKLGPRGHQPSVSDQSPST